MQELEKNKVTQLSFSGKHVDAKLIQNVQDYLVHGRGIVINPSMKRAIINEYPEKCIDPLFSTILINSSIKRADFLIIISIMDSHNIGNVILEPGWELLGNTIPKNVATENTEELTFPTDTPLWRSPEESICIIEFDPYYVVGQNAVEKNKEKFNIKVNLWFATSNTDCFIHNEHDFMEVHTQIYGNGRMQKFKMQDYDTLYEDIIMPPGYTTPIPFCNIEGQHNYVYPWHQYYADTDCIWLAIEYHPIR